MTAIHITMRHGEVPEDLQTFVDEKVHRMEKYLKQSSRVEVILDRENANYKCELIVHSARRGGGQIVVKDSSPEIHACIDLAVEKLTRTLARSKDRRKDHHRGLRREELPGVAGPAGGTEEPSYEDIVNREIKGG